MTSKKFRVKSKKLKIFLIISAVLVAADIASTVILTQVETKKMDDAFAHAEKQVFTLDPEKISYITVRNGNGEEYDFTGEELDWAINKLNGFKAKRVRGMWPIGMSGWSYALFIGDNSGNKSFYTIYSDSLKCDFVNFIGSSGYFDDFIEYVSLDK